ncbi:uncharacterized protein LOC124132030 [Haliotis rufescens]|uniref:uncharacterized protein LOC124132030 n=1 Tax=Haliotis rufescens TaxID=6454 RepID=UPI00201EB0A3|nr:uncharacterized protein LOC124132030 [Haliotis rufescens]
MMLIFVLFCVLHVVRICNSQVSDPCVVAMDIPDIEKRDIQYQRSSGEDIITDRFLKEGWYKPQNGAVLAGEAPGSQRCGTVYPIYRTKKDGTTSTLCIQTSREVCYSSFEIQTHMCEGVEVYKLKTTTIHYSGYCFAPAPATPPDFNEKPTVITKLVRKFVDITELEFHCEFNKHPDDVFYRTYWYVDGKLMIVRDPEKWDDGNVTQKQVLTEDVLRTGGITTVGFEISCSIRVTHGINTTASVPVQSDRKFIGIKLSHTTLVLKEGERANISLQLTAPFGCETFRDRCGIIIAARTTNNQSPGQCGNNILSPSLCGVEMLSSPLEVAYTFTVVGGITGAYGSATNTQKLILTTDLHLPHTLWSNYSLGQITVQITKDTSKIQNKFCYATNDPHMKTFDGRRYEHQYNGTFTMYKHDKLPIEVQLRTTECGPLAWCNCGLAVRAGRTVFEFNRCGDLTNIWKLEHTLCDDGEDVLQVKRRGSRYEIYLPTGGKVRVNLYGSYLDVYIYPSVQDIENSRGLCGKLSDVCSDDFIMRDGSYSTDITSTDDCNAPYRNWENLLTTFSNSWRVDLQTNDLFNPDLNTSLGPWPRSNAYCSCTEPQNGQPVREVTCKASNAHRICSPSEGYTSVNAKCTIKERRKRRSVKVTSTGKEIYRHKRQVEGEWLDGWTEGKARAYCERVFEESGSVQVCSNMTGVDTDESLDNCVLDIRLTGNTTFSPSAVDTVRDKCLYEVNINPELQQSSEASNQSVKAIVEARTCSGDCGGHGSCVEGDCVCAKDYGGGDCSVHLTDPPEIDSIEDDGHCDTSRGPCQAISVYGETFLDNQTSCLMEAVRVYSTTSDNIWARTSRGSVISISQVDCDISSLGVTEEAAEDSAFIWAFRIAVSNNPSNFSESVGMIMYDSTCVKGTVNGTDFSWTLEGPYCLHGGTCLLQGTTHPLDPCLVCHVSGSARSWTNSAAPDFNTPVTIVTELVRKGDLATELEFHCQFIKHPYDVFYTTNWFVDGDLVAATNPEQWDDGNVTQMHALTEDDLRANNITTVGFEIRCSVRVSKCLNTTAGAPVQSEAKFIGIKLSSTSLILKEGESADISLQLTAPFGCQKFLMDINQCELHVETYSIKKDPTTTNPCDNAVLTRSTCGVTIPFSRWNETHTIKVFGSISVRYGLSTQNFKLALGTGDVIPHELWSNYNTGQITVQIIKDTSDVEGKSCFAVNDPHMKTFDGRRYEHQYNGTFTMYTYTERPIEVQLRTFKCGSRAWCNCGVAVRAGRTVFEFNRCPDVTDIWSIEYTLCEDGGDVLQVKRRESSYQVYLPTGGKVDINFYRKSRYLNVYIYPSVQDVGKSRGLCGNLSDVCNDDFVMRDGSYSTDKTSTDACNAGYRVWENLLTTFSNSWRVEDHDDLFNRDTHARLDPWKKTDTFCSCTKDPTSGTLVREVNCTALAAVNICSTLNGYKGVIPSKCTIKERRKRRSIQLTSNWKESHRQKRQTEGEWQDGWTEDQARAYCDKVFHDSRSVQVCSNVTGVDTHGSIDNCVLDIRLTGTTEFSPYAVDTVRDKCLHEVVVNPVLQEKNETSATNQSVHDIVVAEACLNDCGGNGYCIEGDCVCAKDYGGGDCSVDLTAAPEIHSVDDDGHCDMSRHDCQGISIYGETFIDNLTSCHVEAFRVYNTSSERKWSRTSLGSVVSISQVDCDISPQSVIDNGNAAENAAFIWAYTISVSNNPTNFSASVGVILYDSTCVIGTVNGTDFSWTLEGAYCLHEGKCVVNGSRHPDVPCRVPCDVSNSERRWINSSASACSDTTTPVVVTQTSTASPATTTTTKAFTSTMTPSTAASAQSSASTEATTDASLPISSSETTTATTRSETSTATTYHETTTDAFSDETTLADTSRETSTTTTYHDTTTGASSDETTPTATSRETSTTTTYDDTTTGASSDDTTPTTTSRETSITTTHPDTTTGASSDDTTPTATSRETSITTTYDDTTTSTSSSKRTPAATSTDTSTTTTYDDTTTSTSSSKTTLAATSRETSTTTTKDDTTTAPAFNEETTVSTKLVRKDVFKTELEFHCEFKKHPDDVYYSTYWVVDGGQVDAKDPEQWNDGNVTQKHALTEDVLRAAGITTVGFEIRCFIIVRRGVNTLASVPVFSEPKFIGIKLSSTTLFLKEGESADISLQFTAPFGCQTSVIDQCEIFINAYTLGKENPNSCDNTVLTRSICGVAIHSSRWNETYTIKVFGSISVRYGLSTQNLTLALGTGDVIQHQLWSNYNPGPITVQVLKNTSQIQNKDCFATNDPHMKTFDGRRYEHQYEGTFSMYKHSELPIEVQLKTTQCGSRASCNCGLAVRAGRTVFELNRCADLTNIWKIQYTLCEDGGDVLQVKRRGSSYEVYLPTGGKISIYLYSTFLNVYIYPSVQDIGNSRGLCGKLSDVCSDDFVMRDGSYSADNTSTDACNARYRIWENLLTTFSNSWRVNGEEDLFDYDTHRRLDPWSKTNTFCSCTKDPTGIQLVREVTCTADAARTICSTLYGFTDVRQTDCSIKERRKRRYANIQSARKEPQRLKRQAEGEWLDGWTEEKARAYCTKIFQASRSVQVCNNVTGVDTMGSIDNCVLDIRLTGTTAFAAFALDTVRDKCLHEVAVNPVLQKKSGASANHSIYDIVVAEACLNDCSGHGNCTEGECDCDADYNGVDCSVDLTAPPAIDSIQDNGHCDTSRNQCHVISVYGEIFLDNLTSCHVDAFRVYNTSSERKWSRTSLGSVVSISQVDCDISSQSVIDNGDAAKNAAYILAYKISVSNKPTNFSSSVGVMLYDSTCINGTVNGTDFTWTLKGAYCLHEGKCVMNGSSHPVLPCTVCDVSDGGRRWVNSAVPACTETTTLTSATTAYVETTAPTTTTRTMATTVFTETTSTAPTMSGEISSSAKTTTATWSVEKTTTTTSSETTTATESVKGYKISLVASVAASVGGVVILSVVAVILFVVFVRYKNNDKALLNTSISANSQENLPPFGKNSLGKNTWIPRPKTMT